MTILAVSAVVHPAAKGVRQKEFGKKVTKKVTEASEKVTEKWPKASRKRKKVIELLLPHSFCGTLSCGGFSRDGYPLKLNPPFPWSWVMSCFKIFVQHLLCDPTGTLLGCFLERCLIRLTFWDTLWEQICLPDQSALIDASLCRKPL